MSSGRQVVVVGAGAVGAASALHLARDGWDVTVVDAGPSWAAGASAGNAGLLCASHAGRWARRSDLVDALRWMLDPEGALRIRPTPAVTAFLTRAMTMSAEAARRADALSARLCARALDGHRRLVEEGLDWGLAWEGLLDVYRTEAAFAAAASRALRPGDEALDRAEAAAREPALGRRVAGAVWRAGDGHGDPIRFVAGLGALAVAAGASARFGARVRGIERRGSRLRVVLQPSGAGTPPPLPADRVLLATGAATVGLSRGTIGRDVLAAGRGQSTDLRSGTVAPLARPLILAEDRVAITPLPGRLRVAGQMEFGARPGVDARRLAAMRRHTHVVLPAWERAIATPGWTGDRPCTPDGNPLLGWLDAQESIAVATGHAMLGLTLAPVTGQQVSALFAGRPDPDLPALSPARFR